MKTYLCKCNNCEQLLIDENPQIKAKKYPIPAKAIAMGENQTCPNCKTDGFLVDFENSVIYISEHKDYFRWTDFLDAAKGNENYAIRLLDHVTWQSPYTVVDEDIREGEVIEFMEQYFLTEGNEYLSGDEAKRFGQNVSTASSIGGFEGNNYPKIGGYYSHVGQFIAFDNTSGNFNMDVFSDEEEAKKYACGKPAITISGETF
jgi:CTP-dependent riboflavin kinase